MRLPFKSMQVLCKGHIGHVNAFFVKFLRSLLGHDFIVLTQKLQEIFKFCEVFEITKKSNVKN